jgi:phosphoenolpyruvate-protein kinase (PTS system EI component)
MRTADLVGDKKKNMRPEEIERLIRNQLEAIHTVSKEYPKTFYVMFPQIDNIADFEKYAAWHREAAEKVGVAPLKCGSMIESVSAVALLNQILDHKDLEFISVGTNDLIANVLNYDRYSSEANEKYDPTNPAVLIQLREIITKANAKRVPVSVCGDMASDPRYFALLVGLGYKHVSSAVGLVPMMKEIGNRIDTEKARALVETIFKNPKMTKQEREQLLDDFNQKELGLYPDGQIEMAWPPEERPPAAAATPNDA